MFFWRGDTDWKNNIAGQREIFLPVAILFAVGLGVALWTIMHGIQDQRRTNVAYMLILGWIGIGSLPSILTVKEIHPLRASLMIPPVFLVAAIGAERIYAWLEQKTPWAFRITVIICFVVLCAGNPARRISGIGHPMFMWPAHLKNGWSMKRRKFATHRASRRSTSRFRGPFSFFRRCRK